MTLVIEACAAAVLGAAIISLIIILRFFMTIPVGSVTGGGLYTVISVSGGAPELESTVGGLSWLIKTGRLDCKVLIIDRGLDHNARCAAEILARDKMHITLCSPDEAAEILKKG